VEHSRASWQNKWRDFPSECARLIADRIGGGAIEAIFLCGSLAAGDETVIMEEGRIVLLSDVDLVVVLKRLEDLLAWGPRRAELGEACEALMPDVCFAGRVDVGVMLPEDLARLPARPGVYDMRERGKVLKGNAKILDRIPRFPPSDITVRESIILVENRIVTLIDSRPERPVAGDMDRYARWYRVARAYTDIAAASLSIAGMYVPGYAERRDLIRAEVTRDTGGLLAKLVSGDALRAIDRWTRFKLDPATETALLRSEPAAYERIWEETARDTLLFWRKASSRERRPFSDVSSPLPVGALVGKARSLRVWRDHVRGWKTYLARLPVSRRLAIAMGLGTKLIAVSPLDAVREEGVRLLDHRVTKGSGVPLHGARGGFLDRGGGWDRAAADLGALWNDLVFGRPNG
jgi:hypothetical protein